MGNQKGSIFYDRLYENSNEYKKKYFNSSYYHLWSIIIGELRKIENLQILEIGCGVGQLANYIDEIENKTYYGFDFSKKAIKVAKKTNPQMNFFIGNALDLKNYNIRYNTCICTEVLEHINNDIKVISFIKPKKIFIFSIPRFNDPAHVRFFITKDSIIKRYSKLLDIKKIIRVDSYYLIISKRRLNKSNPPKKIKRKIRRIIKGIVFSPLIEYILNQIK